MPTTRTSWPRPAAEAAGRGSEPPESLAVAARDLAVSYGRHRVLHGLSLAVARGEVAGLTGSNGSGKSTFLKTCLGLLKPKAGSIAVLGHAPGSAGYKSIRLSIGYAAQSAVRGTLPVTARDAVAMGRYGIAGFGRPLRGRDHELVDEAIASVGMGAHAKRLVGELSGGQLQRIAIARSLAMEPELLLLDEPTAHIDRETNLELVQLLAGLAAERRMTVLVVTHDPEVLAVCTAVFTFAGGCVSEQAEPLRV
jgi:ABC-type Mn2+/Zn2+ transport system ATPase subunit